MGLPDPVQEFIIGEVRRLRAEFFDEDDNPADPDTDITFILIDDANAEITNITEVIGALSTIQREGSIGSGVFFVRHLVVSGDSTKDETWEYKFKCTSAAGAVAATGSITAVDPSNYTDGQAFTLDDAFNTPVRFEFDDNAIVKAGSIIIDLTAPADADALALAIEAAINGAPSLGITALATGAVVALTNDTAGSRGNTAVTLEGSPPGVFTAMGGGRPQGPATAKRRRFRVLASDFPNP